jgi:protein O-GlcNAc transferase
MSAEPAIRQALSWLSRNDPGRAIRELEALAACEPASALVYNALGSVLAGQGQSQPALAAFQRALSLRPDFPEAHANLGNLLLEGGQILEALAAFERTIASGRAPAQAHAGAGRALLLLGRSRAATLAFQRAVLCAGAHAGIHSQRCYASLLDPELAPQQIVAIHRAYERAVITPSTRSPQRSERDAEPKSPLCLGYVSADFREHSVASFLEGLLSAHDRGAVALFAYSDAAREDATTERLRGHFEKFRRVVGMPHDELARLIQSDRIDVLIDLSGHMQPNRLPLFARRPAPRALTYLGYPGTTGTSLFDARVTDHWADPVDDPEFAGPEALVHVEGGCLTYTPPPEAPEVSPLPAESSGAVTFCSMNDALKLNATVLETWATLLHRAPKSRLMLKARALGFEAVRARILETLTSSGVDAERIELWPAAPSRREHLALYSRADVALDTFPYAGATTTCEALHMGVPVITLAGNRHAARLGVSILSSAKLEGFVAASCDEYVELALRWASDIPRLAALRHTLRAHVRASPLCDARRVARAIERAAREGR